MQELEAVVFASDSLRNLCLNYQKFINTVELIEDETLERFEKLKKAYNPFTGDNIDLLLNPVVDNTVISCEVNFGENSDPHAECGVGG